jgi:Peptidase C26
MANKKPRLGISVFVIGPYCQHEEGVFHHWGYDIVRRISEADMVVWTGGHDISPSLYGQPTLDICYLNINRDNVEIEAYRNAKGKFKIGICRGAQLLNVLNGGKLWQHCNNHKEPHEIKDHKTDRIIAVNSIHHQQMIPTRLAEVVATCEVSTYKVQPMFKWERYPKDEKAKLINWPSEYSTDYEVLWYPKTRCFCFQPHPEYNEPESTAEYFFDLLKRYYN